MKVTINKEQYRKLVLDPIGEYWYKKLQGEYVKDFDKKSLGSYGFGNIKWDPLKPRTISAKTKAGSAYATRILRRFSALRNGIKCIYSKEKTSLIIFVEPTVTYAKYHNEGGKNLPKREILGEPPQKIVDKIKNDVEKTTKNFIGDMFKQLKSKNINVTGFNF